MEKITMKNEPVLIDNHDFQSILVKVLFPYIESEENLAKEALLFCMLNQMSEHYPSEDCFQKEKKKRMILGSSCYKTVIGNSGCFVFNFIIPDTYALGSDMLDEQFSFLEEIIYHPYLEDNGFSSKELEREIENIRVGIDNSFKNIRTYQDIHIRKLIDDEGILSRSLVHHTELLDEVTPQNLYDFYRHMILENQPVIYVMGNMDHDRIRSLCKKYVFKKSYSTKVWEAQFYHFLKPREKVLEYEENTTYKDSSLSIVYKITNMTKEDTIYLSLIKDLLSSGSTRLLNKKLRYEKDLIYSSKVVPYLHFGAFEITAYIKKEHMEEVKAAILEVVKDLENVELIKPLLENIKARNHVNLLRQLDDKYFLMEDFVLKDLGADDSLEEFYQKEEKVTAEEIASFMKRFVLDTVCFLKEEEHE